jgi:valacyclovir hydrolase
MPFFTHHGHRLHYREQEDSSAQGHLLLLLPGNTATSAHHAGELAYFGARYHAVSLDFWGTGQSDRLAIWPDDWYQQAAHDAAGLVAHLGKPCTTVIGTSGGASVALWMAVLHPDLVSAVIADSTVAVYPPHLLLATMRDRTRRTADQVAFWQDAHGPDWEQVIDADTGMLHRLADRGGRMAPEVLDDILCPVLLTATLDDTMLPNVGHQLVDMARLIRNARVYLTKGGDHPLMWSQAGEFRRVCDLFLHERVGLYAAGA